MYSTLRSVLLVGTLLVLSLSPNSQAAETNEFTAQRIVAFGDVHGANDALVGLLQANKIIDSALHWQAGRTHLVSVGDLLDRGPDSRATMDLLIRLQVEARAAGGRVHVVLGNHEALNLMGDLRDVSAAEYAAFATDPLSPTVAQSASDIQSADQPAGYLQHRAAFAPTGTYGRWLLSLPAMIKINRTLFTHGGLPPLVGELGIDKINANIRSGLLTAIRARDPDAALPPELDGSGPLWYRGTAVCHPLLETQNLSQVLSATGADRVVIGHTPTASRQIESRLNERVISIDTGMLYDFYRGAAFALELSGASVRTLSAEGSTDSIAWSDSLLLVPAAQESQLAERLAAHELVAAEKSANIEGTPVSVMLNSGQIFKGSFFKASKREANNAVATWRLDRKLGLHMVPITLKHKLGRRSGYVQFSPGRWLTERSRLEREINRPNYCATGHAYDLVAAFDAITGADPRSASSLSYNTRSWALRVTDSHKTFSTRRQLRNYPVTPTLPNVLAARLSDLTEQELSALTGDLLTKPQLKAIRARLAQTLVWPKSGLKTVAGSQ